MLRQLAIAATLALSSAACCCGVPLPAEERVHASAAGDATLAIANRGSDTVYVQAADPTELALMAACTPRTCARIAPGEILRLPYAEIAYWQPGDAQAAVRWWVFSFDGGALETGTVTVSL